MSDGQAIFFDRDSQYLDWLARSPNGYVLNIRATHDPGYIVLHRARCRSISSPAVNSPPGGFTEREYRKVCASDLDTLCDWARAYGRQDGTFSNECSVCMLKRSS